MSVRLMADVWESALPRTEKFTLLCLADFASDDGSRIFPSVAVIAAKTSTSERAVQRAINTLTALGILEVVAEAKFHRPREYRINRGAILSPLTDEQGCHHVTPEGENRGATMTPLEPRGVTLCRQRGATLSPPIGEPSGNHQVTQRQNSTDDDVSTKSQAAALVTNPAATTTPVAAAPDLLDALIAEEPKLWASVLDPRETLTRIGRAYPALDIPAEVRRAVAAIGPPGERKPNWNLTGWLKNWLAIADRDRINPPKGIDHDATGNPSRKRPTAGAPDAPGGAAGRDKFARERERSARRAAAAAAAT